MPRTVDHGERRFMILDAFVSLAVREGLHAVSMRSVAAEAGISLRLVQYYFKTKSGLMQAGLTMLEKMSNERWANHISTFPESSTAAETLKALFVEALPTDSRQRDFHLLWMSYAVLGMTDATIPNHAIMEGPKRLLQRVTALLTQGQAAGEFDSKFDADDEAAILLGLIHGLGTSVLIGLQSGATALELLSLHLDRLTKGKDQPMES